MLETIRCAVKVCGRLVGILERQPSWIVTGVALVLVMGIGVADYLSGAEWSFSIFYLLAVSLAVWFAGKTSGILTAAASAIVWLVADLGAGFHASAVAPCWNAVIRLGVFVIVVFLFSALKELNAKTERIVQERTAQLTAEITEREQVQQQLIEIRNEEHGRIAQELHDGLCQDLTAIAFKAKLLQDTLAPGSEKEAREAARIVALLNRAVGQAYRLARGLDPIELAGDGLPSALDKLARHTEEVFGVDCTVSAEPVTWPLDKRTSAHLYRIAQEAINNAVRHGQPQRVRIELKTANRQLCLTVEDDGTGFRPETPPQRGMGLRFMRYRAGSIGAALEIDSRPKEGTRVRCVVPQTRPVAPTEQSAV